VTVADRDAVAMTLRLSRDEATLAGGSAGVAVCAAIRVACRLGAGKRVVTIVPDTGRHYLSTYFDESWRTSRGLLRSRHHRRKAPERVRRADSPKGTRHMKSVSGECCSRADYPCLGGCRLNRVMRRFLLVAVAAFVALGCAEQHVSLAHGSREYVPNDYPQVLKRWTRSESLFALAELDEKLTVSATFESWDFRWAYVVKYASDYRLTVEQRRELLDRTLAETQDSHEFYVALYGSNYRWTDMSKLTSAWIVRLIDDQGSETAPSKIELIAKPGPLERRYFPYTTVWRRAFRVRFPRTTGDGRPTIAANARWFGLRFAGAEGNEELHWDLETSEQQRAAFGSGAASRAREDLE
jgi:hypothetical protein